MPRANASKSYFNFIGGMNTDSSPLNSPENTARLLQNIDLEISGVLSRRLGLDFESEFTLSTDTFTDTVMRDSGVSFHEWLVAAEDGNVNFFVVRIAEKLYIFNMARTAPSSNLVGTVDFTSLAVDLSLFQKAIIDVSSGNGILVVTGEQLYPFYIEYDIATATFSTTQIDLEVRDFEGVDDGLENSTRPTTLTASHAYNLLNQGWEAKRTNAFSVGSTSTPPPYNDFDMDALVGNTATGSNKFPANSDIAFLGQKADGDGNPIFDIRQITSQTFGNTPASKGHFVLNVFDGSRAIISGIDPLPAFNTNRRPTSTTFFAGRVWYGGLRGQVYFSQVLEDLSKIGKAYQEQDPTAEEFNELLDTDGGVLNIAEAGVVYKVVNILDSILVLASNGVWQISGGESNFTATTFVVSKVSDVGAIGAASVVVAEDSVYYWNEGGIYLLKLDESQLTFQATSITENVITTDYLEIPAAAKILAQGAYDKENKLIYWSFHDGQISSATVLDSKFNSVLVLNIPLRAFYIYLISDLPVDGVLSPFMAGMRKSSARNAGSSNENVTAVGVVVTAATVDVTVPVSFTDSSSKLPIKVLVFTPQSGVYKFTFSDFNSRSFHDWLGQDAAGVDYKSIVETGYEVLGEAMRDKQATYLFSFFHRKRGGFGSIFANGRADPSFGFRDSQFALELLLNSPPLMRSSQVALEILSNSPPLLRSSQVALEYLMES